MLEQKQKKPPRLAIIALMAAGLAVVLVFTLTPWNFIPTQVTEDVTVLAIIEHGCVGESQYGVSVVVPQCSAQVGDIVSATFYVPAMELNGYYDRLQDRVDVVIP
ncbi:MULTISPECIES: hypothetical protein [Nitrosopumilus]|uniref:Uncharacterized protein n=1 Tax=Nitrosopumilus piranensis TaxID=1582439 RepID=A0A0C5BQ06_9ARCH|nr:MULTISPECIES: hypothetical protein [Nitrosopumilus]AJM91788.1 conserved exported protein of unknown function [Nitrosopumilus piranensis]KAF6245488.1 hypothetical protein C6989_03410 [Nitrosopumilus sp. b2]